MTYSLTVYELLWDRLPINLSAYSASKHTR